MAITQSSPTKQHTVPKNASEADVERELRILGLSTDGDKDEKYQRLNDAEKPDNWEFGT